MPFKEPFILGPFSVDAEGRLSLSRQDVSPGFSVRWRGRVVHARLDQNDPRRWASAYPVQSRPNSEYGV